MKKVLFLLTFLFFAPLLHAQNPYPDTWTRCEAYRKEPDRKPELTTITEYDRKSNVMKITRLGMFASVFYFPQEGNWSAHVSAGREYKDSTWTVTTKKEQKTYRYSGDTLTGYTVSTLNKKGKAIRSVEYHEDKTVYARETCTYLHDTLITSRVRYTYWNYDDMELPPELADSIIWEYNEQGLPISELRYNRYTHQVDTFLSDWYTYENNGKTKKWQSFDERDGRIVVFRDFTETVDEKGRRIEFIEAAPWWGIYMRQVYRYNEQGNLSEERMINEAGEQVGKITYEYKYFE